MAPNKIKKKKKKNKRWYQRIKVRPLDPTKLVLGLVSGAMLFSVSVITDMRTDCQDVEQQMVQEQRENPGTEVRYVGVGGVICSIADGGGGLNGGFGNP